MKKLFLSSFLIILLLISCSSTKSGELPPYADGYYLEGEEASIYYLSLLEKNECPEFRYNYIYSLFESGRLDDSLDELIIAEEMYKEYLRFYKLEYFVYEEKNDSNGMISALHKLLSIDPVNEKAIEKLIDELNLQNEKDEIEKISLDLLSLDPKNKEALRNLSKINENYKTLYNELK